MSDGARRAIDGGTPVRDCTQRPWPAWPIYDATEEQALHSVLHSDAWWSADGSEGKRFEAEFAAYQQASFGLTCTSGTVALEIALRALGIGYGDEVILPAYTFVATATAILTVGAIPRFVDIQPDTLNLDSAQIEAALTSRTRAVVPVHVAGRPADLDAILEIARKHGLAVVEDAAQAHGAAWRGRGVGAHGDLGTFSFQASKNLNAGEGGAIVTDNARLADAAWSIINVGRVRDGSLPGIQTLGGNFRLSEFQSAVLRTQLRRLSEQTARRTANALYLRDLLSQIPGIILPTDDPRITTHAYHLFTFRVTPERLGASNHSAFAAALRAEGIPCSGGYAPLYREPLFTHLAHGELPGRPSGIYPDYTALSLPACEQVCRDTVWLPQTLLLAERRDMEDIAAALSKTLVS